MNNDTKERLVIGFKFLFQSYKVMMGSLLTLFVPQECNINNELVICSVQNNIEKNELINSISLGCNFLSVLLFIGCYIIELKRENFLIKHLDINHDFPDNNLDTILSTKPELSKQLIKFNKFYFTYVKYLVTFYFINLIVSSISIYDHYAGVSTLTSYISYTSLILLKLYNSTYISYKSFKKNRALSSYIIEFSSFNVYDKDFLEQSNDEEKNKIVNPDTLTLELDNK